MRAQLAMLTMTFYEMREPTRTRKVPYSQRMCKTIFEEALEKGLIEPLKRRARMARRK